MSVWIAMTIHLIVVEIFSLNQSGKLTDTESFILPHFQLPSLNLRSLQSSYSCARKQKASMQRSSGTIWHVVVLTAVLTIGNGEQCQHFLSCWHVSQATVDEELAAYNGSTISSLLTLWSSVYLDLMRQIRIEKRGSFLRVDCMWRSGFTVRLKGRMCVYIYVYIWFIVIFFIMFRRCSSIRFVCRSIYILF